MNNSIIEDSYENLKSDFNKEISNKTSNELSCLVKKYQRECNCNEECLSYLFDHPNIRNLQEVDFFKIYDMYNDCDTKDIPSLEDTKNLFIKVLIDFNYKCGIDMLTNLDTFNKLRCYGMDIRSACKGDQICESKIFNNNVALTKCIPVKLRNLFKNDKETSVLKTSIELLGKDNSLERSENNNTTNYDENSTINYDENNSTINYDENKEYDENINFSTDFSNIFEINQTYPDIVRNTTEIPYYNSKEINKNISVGKGTYLPIATSFPLLILGLVSLIFIFGQKWKTEKFRLCSFFSLISIVGLLSTGYVYYTLGYFHE